MNAYFSNINDITMADRERFVCFFFKSMPQDNQQLATPGSQSQQPSTSNTVQEPQPSTSSMVQEPQPSTSSTVQEPQPSTSKGTSGGHRDLVRWGHIMVDDNSDSDDAATDTQDTPPTQPRKRKCSGDIKCHICGRGFSSYENLLRHHNVIHQTMGMECEECGSRFTSGKLLAHHRLICGIQQSPPTKKRKSGSQVGRGHRAAFQEHAAIESFTPTHDHDILAALK